MGCLVKFLLYIVSSVSEPVSESVRGVSNMNQGRVRVLVSKSILPVQLGGSGGALQALPSRSGLEPHKLATAF